ncbi:hypothetical protein L593_10330 [Salinarchaeum sp. Harcht-Bsk1]|uniref:hypothetical protein n=1 Tax=Salinarchaeum sp. Harcht-Bsk1 TaxID=1333523 RepID=UPI00034242C8|nr:hypothetical protein [Salinarchaeum sp. Harcht-Bsk1]AGN02011.1 hypothetical protein L593_10330 [Salinarchaeum sp. Harcht-Bsk1]
MGRTRATTRDRLDALEREWMPFRRSLRRRHQPAFDRLFEHARGHAEAATQQNPADPWRGFVFAVLLAQEQATAAREEEIAALEEKLADREAEVERLAADVDALHERVAELAGESVAADPEPSA